MIWTATSGIGRAMRPAAEAYDGRRGTAEVDPLISHLDSLQDLPPVDHNSRPLIRLAAGQLDRIAGEAEAAIITRGLPVFRRGYELVRPVTREVAAAGGRTILAAGLRTLTLPALLDIYCQAARWEKFDGRKASYVAADPPDRVAAIHLARAGYWAHPPIAGVVTTPTLRPDGSVASEPGYDSATRLFLLPDPALRLPPLAERPTRGEAAASLELLQRLIDGFPFVSDVDRAGALTALITPVVRGAFANAPLFAVRASSPGTGKSMLVDLASTISTGRACPVTSVPPGDPAELDKRLVGLLLEGLATASVDNVNGELGGDLLCQLLTQPAVRLRRLGASDMAEIETGMTLFSTGNGLTLRGDLVRRSILVTLDAGVERPELRQFDFDPCEMVAADRGRYVAACMTICRAFRASGASPLPPLASFEGWSSMVRSALYWLGAGDCCDSMEAARDEDPELGTLRDVIATWRAAFSDERLTVRQIIGRAQARNGGYGGDDGLALPDLCDALVRVAGERGLISSRRLGNWLRVRQGRIVNGFKIVRDGEHKVEGVRWRCVPVDRE